MSRAVRHHVAADFRVQQRIPANLWNEPRPGAAEDSGGKNVRKEPRTK
jgi:hypothetical protein